MTFVSFISSLQNSFLYFSQKKEEIHIFNTKNQFFVVFSTFSKFFFTEK